MEAVNAAYSYQNIKGDNIHPGVMKEVLELLVLMLAPFAPHLGEELWQRLGHQASVHLQSWPEYDEKALQVSEVEIVVQINGKVRGRLHVPVGLDKDAVQKLVLEEGQIARHLEGKEIVKVISVPDKLVNLVVR